MKSIISIEEARDILGSDADNLSNKDIEYVIDTLDLLAKDTLDKTKHKILLRKASLDMAKFLYDIYEEEQYKNNASSPKSR